MSETKSVAPERLWVGPSGVTIGKPVEGGSIEYIRADAFPDHIGLTFAHMQEQIAGLKRRVAELELTEHCGRIEL